MPSNLDGVAGTTLRTSHYPGDNYVVAASTSQDWLQELRAIQPSSSGEIRHADGEPLTTRDRQQLSELVTVWRTLHVPLERMDTSTTSQDQLELRSTYTRIDKRGTRLQDHNVTFLDFITPDNVQDHPNKDDIVADMLAQEWGQFEEEALALAYRVSPGTSVLSQK